MQLKANNSNHLTWWRAGSHVEAQLPQERTLIAFGRCLYTHTQTLYIYIYVLLYFCTHLEIHKEVQD